MVTDLVLIVIVAIIAQTVVEQLKNTVKFHSGKYFKGIVNLKAVTSIIVSVLMCLCYRCDIMVLLGLTSSIPVIGYLITAMIVAGGSSVVHNLVAQILEAKNNSNSGE